MDAKLIILPLTGLVIGFFTNWLAIKFLFLPRKKILGIQGVIPKRKEKIAEAIAESSLRVLPKKIDDLTKVPYIGAKIKNYIKKEVSLKVKKINNKDLQKIIEETAKKELRFIQFSGAVLGFIIGIIQYLILEII
jgi:uncharacterized membrane protein YheB (UPF0754 family)